jgi:hypothetical protein
VAVAVLAPEIIPAPAQLKVTPALVEEPLTVEVLVVQSMEGPLVAFTFGTVVFDVMVTVDTLVQLLEGSVTVRVYVPAALTVAVEVLAPDVIPAPVQL